ncbi:MAG: chorismate synthase [Lentisphaeria bacterium]|nr:chorismate synthase [Lentisphaeria bacterium]
MSGNLFGKLFQVMTFGESHGPAIGAVVDGMVAGIEISEEDIQKELDRRRPGQSKVTTARRESDQVEILSGIFEGKTTGTPIALLIRNSDQHSSDYSNIKDVFRPGHADYTYFAKYGIRDYRGGGRSSGRETAGRVAAGALAKKLLEHFGISVVAFTKSVGNVHGAIFEPDFIEKNIVRAADPEQAGNMEKAILEAAQAHDSIGGVVECHIYGLPAGLGNPCFDKLDAELAKALMSIGGVKGVEIGDGFDVVSKLGSENNDFMRSGGFVTNHAGGILGGISNGNTVILRCAVKPTPSIAQKQQTVTVADENRDIEIHGRHDPCLVPRVVVVAEAMCALVIADMLRVSGLAGDKI